MTSEYSKGGLDLYSPTQIVIKMKMIVLNEVKESSVVGNSRMYKLNVESSRGVSFGCFNLSYQRGNIQSLCASVQSLCVGSKANGEGYGPGLDPGLQPVDHWPHTFWKGRTYFASWFRHSFLSRDVLCCLPSKFKNPKERGFVFYQF